MGRICRLRHQHSEQGSVQGTFYGYGETCILSMVIGFSLRFQSREIDLNGGAVAGGGASLPKYLHLLIPIPVLPLLLMVQGALC